MLKRTFPTQYHNINSINHIIIIYSITYYNINF